MSGAMETRLRGVLAPVLTPFGVDGRPSAPRFVKHCRWLLQRGVGLAVFGTNSEASSLSLAEKRRLLDTLLDAGLPPSRLMPGTGACALPDTIELTRHAVQAGCAGVLMLPPFYYKGVSDEGLFRSYARVIEAVASDRLRIYLYHIPPVSQVPLGIALIDRLLRAFPGTIAGIKDSGGDAAHTERLVDELQPRGLDVFAGNETLLLRTLRRGGAGCITATGNVNPAAIVALAERWRDADADAQQQGLDAVRAAFQAFPMIAAMKAAMAGATGDGQWAAVRPPLVELTAGEAASLQSRLDALGFSIADADRLRHSDIAPVCGPAIV